jgi:hypothetical protein
MWCGLVPAAPVRSRTDTGPAASIEVLLPLVTEDSPVTRLRLNPRAGRLMMDAFKR